MNLKKASKSEELIWRRYKVNPMDPGLILSYGFSAYGKMKEKKLIAVLNVLVRNYFPNLQSSFMEVEGTLYKQTNVHDEINLKVVNHTPNLNDLYAINHSKTKLYRFYYQKISKKQHFIGFQFSHLVFDGTCYEKFCAAFENEWNGVKYNKEVAKKSKTKNIATNDESVKFWDAKLTSLRLSQKIPFATDASRNYTHFSSLRKSIQGKQYEELTKKLKKENITLFQFLTSVVSVSIFKYLFDDNKAVYLNYTVNTKQQKQPEGCYLNVIPMEIPQSNEWTPKDYFSYIKKERNEVREHQNFPTLDMLQLASKKNMLNTDVLNVVINHSQGLIPVKVPELKKVSFKFHTTPLTSGPFHLGINYSFSDTKLHIAFDAPSNLLCIDVLDAFAENFEKTIAFFIKNSTSPISELSFEKNLTPVSSGKKKSYAKSKTLRQIFEKNIQKYNAKKAVIYNETTLTYDELLTDSLRIAKKLLSEVPKKKLSKGVGLHLTRTESIPCAILACMLLEIPFVPMEASLPNDRIDYMLSAAKIKVVLQDEHINEKSNYTNNAIHTICVDKKFQNSWGDLSTVTLQQFGQKTAYIMFTSGSTGNPKGVMISTANLLNFLHAMKAQLPVSKKDYFLAITSISFDISLLELLLPLFVGATLEIVDDEVRKSASSLAQKIQTSPISFIQTTPSIWRLLKSSNWKATKKMTLVSGGEALPQDIAAYLLQQSSFVYNVYGPTEATIWASVKKLQSSKEITLGTPVYNTSFYVVNEKLEAVSPGMYGELVIAGDSVGLGYLNYDNKGTFITLPEKNKKAYMTGDYVRFLGENTLKFIGRKSGFQKIDGYRIEVEEVSASLKKMYPSTEFITVIRKKPSTHLTSFYAAKSNINEEKTLANLKKILPHYMIPKRLISLDKLPLTVSGKLNVKLLSEMELSAKLTSKKEGIKMHAKHDALHKNISKSLRSIFKDKLEISVDDVTLPLGYLGLTSISYNQLEVAIKEKFQITIEAHEFYQLIHFDGIIEAIKERSTNVFKSTETLAKTAVSKFEKPKNAGAIAIIGYDALMPKNLTPDAFWEALMQQKDLISENESARNVESKAGYLTDIEHFDALFFTISPLEASHMDPRQRLLMETAWKTLEHAAYTPADLQKKNVGCYIATTGNDHSNLMLKEQIAQIPFSISGYSMSILANRISNFFDWRGPSFTLDTACSGALSATVKACNDLAFGVCDTAFVGGINLILDNHVDDGLTAGKFMSPNNRCATFDSEADGYVRGEGVGGFLLKRLDDAIKDNDQIHGVIESYKENHGGKSNSLTAPNPNAQKELLLNTYTPELAKQVSYIETHGTGTKLGDPIEISAVKSAWKQLVGKKQENTVWLGAVKSNIGHLEAAAGVASLLKVLLALKHRELPSNIHFNTINPSINLKNTKFKILSESRKWNDQKVLKAGISSFGFGGSNAHIVVSESPIVQKTQDSNELETHLFVLSANSKKSLDNIKTSFIKYLKNKQPITKNTFANIAYTLSVGRKHFKYRIAWTSNSVEETIAYLSSSQSTIVILNRHELNHQNPELESIDEDFDLELLKKAYLQGSQIPWRAIYQNKNYRKINLPTYKFSGKRYELFSSQAKKYTKLMNK